MSTTLYTRGQITWVLWYLFANQGLEVDAIPSKFKARIKNLLELDWKTKPSRAAGSFAFNRTGPAGAGTDVLFTAGDVFCLAIAMDLVDASEKPGDVVFLLRHIRHELLAEHKWIEDNAGSLDQRLVPQTTTTWPTWCAINGKEWVDFRMFIVLRKLVFKEAFPSLKEVSHKTPVYLEPIFCRGIKALAREMENAGHHYRKAMVVELTRTTETIRDLLPVAPQLKRGRQ